MKNNYSTSDVQLNQLFIFNPTSSLKITNLIVPSCNYSIWKATMILYLKGQKVFGYLDDTLKQP